MKIYKRTHIPETVWEFFNTEKGLSIELLQQAIDVGDPFKTYSFALEMIEIFNGKHLIQYYRDNPPFSIIDLLQYNPYAIRDFICHDGTDEKGYRFHNWLLQNKLKMPSFLVNDGFYNITNLCDESGIEYLNRKIINSPQQDKQAELEKLVQLGVCELPINKQEVLADSLFKGPIYGFDTTDDRFLIFKKHQQNRFFKEHTAVPKEDTTTDMATKMIELNRNGSPMG
ncbi:hypothetical protein Lqui_1443 [Legionella quinlivanii]|uniref:Uncharacterized protein n=1 Tax=Legionella quinlivanii TaxID=45073 RepID=A0A0W0Y0E8_9GAMM|nr:hypothetical protein [Legionella quinlivanii]KTD50118.1 hypothetical protein Lqui_1443 [Legionella quinlivanii]SEF50332.1 hypothetical protein SAMN02746093_00394 [Legionella quinlivanii DSM 21216]STY11716.1 Uncharacterised protein [Legionella quinlivanii]